MENDDHALAILRHFKWNQVKLNDDWWKDTDKLKIEIGLEYDPELTAKYPDIVNTTAAKNDNTCHVCYCEFEEDGDQDMKVD